MNWEEISKKSFGRVGAENSGEIITERMRAYGSNIYIYRDIIMVYKDLSWSVQDIKYVVVNEEIK